MKQIAVDLRCLNYHLLTGVNTYTLHFLYQLWLQKKTKGNLELIGIGLSSQQQTKLSLEFPFFGIMWNQHISIQDYLCVSTKIPIKIINVVVTLDFRLRKKTRNSKLHEFDLLFLPQPRSLSCNPKTQLVTIFHDLYGALQPDELNWKQKIFDNLKLYTIIADDSNVIWVNSISTGLDVQKFLNQSKDKIKLVYPALPTWDKLRKVVD